MRKKRIVCVSVSIVLVVSVYVFFMLYNSNNPLDVKEFSLMKYQLEIEHFPSNKNVGQVDDVNTAIEKAKELWLEKFDIKEKRIEVFYDPNEECWHIRSIARRNVVGGVAHAIIKKNGEVIAIWIDE